jgi:hypothetical protein
MLPVERPSRPPLKPFCRAKAATTHSILPAVFAIQSRRSGEPYSAYSLGCGFSEGTICSRSEVSTSLTPGAFNDSTVGRMLVPHGVVFDLPQRAGFFTAGVINRGLRSLPCLRAGNGLRRRSVSLPAASRATRRIATVD